LSSLSLPFVLLFVPDDYPTQIQESIAELGASVAHGVTSFAAANLKGTNIPAPQVAPAVQPQHKTLPHALSRAALAGAQALGTDLKLGKALDLYGGALQKVHQFCALSLSLELLSIVSSRSVLLVSSRMR